MASKDTEGVPRWKALNYPDPDTYALIHETYPLETEGGTDYYALPAWIRLGWPDGGLWELAARMPERRQAEDRKERPPLPWPVAGWPWSKVKAAYASEDDVRRVIRYWPDCFGQPLVEVDLLLKEGITVNQLTYGPGKHRVPRDVAVDLRYVDQSARQSFMDQFIPKTHQEKVLATLSMKGGEGQGEIRE